MIKLFEEFNNLLYKEIGYDDYFVAITSRGIDISYKYLDDISSILSYGWSFLRKNPNRIILQYGSTPEKMKPENYSFCDILVYIQINDDEYFYVSVDGDGFNSFYECDTIDGLKDLILMIDKNKK